MSLTSEAARDRHHNFFDLEENQPCRDGAGECGAQRDDEPLGATDARAANAKAVRHAVAPTVAAQETWAPSPDGFPSGRRWRRRVERIRAVGIRPDRAPRDKVEPVPVHRPGGHPDVMTTPRMDGPHGDQYKDEKNKEPNAKRPCERGHYEKNRYTKQLEVPVFRSRGSSVEVRIFAGKF